MRHLNSIAEKRIVIWCFILPILAGIWACSSPSSEKIDLKIFDYELKKVSKSYQNCEIGTASCTYIYFSYPEFKNRTKITDSISKKIKAVMFEDTLANAQIKCDQFIDEYSSFLKQDFGDRKYDISWYSTSEVEILTVQKKVISISVKQNDFQGGAHPNLYFYLLNFDPITSNVVYYDHFFSVESQMELIKMIDLELRKRNNMKKSDSLNDIGFMLDGDTLALSDNFAFTENGLLFIYNSYEIAPYAMGIISITLPYDLIEHLYK